MTRVMTITVNGVQHALPVGTERSLLAFLREDLALTGPKNGCDSSGTCGACTVLVNGEARKSCQLKIHDLDGVEIVTIEGLSANGDHPIQKAFINAGAVQCGFCTPGMILATKALLDRNPKPTRDDVLRGLSGNLCRCTGYAKIVEAVLAAASAMESASESACLSSEVGAPLRRPDAQAKVTGAARFGDDQHESGDLVLRVVWSSEVHAEICRIDLDEARRVPGVVAILTATDIPGTNAYGLIHRNQPVLCGDTVRFLGDPVALVIAESDDAAAMAAEKVAVEWRRLEAVTDPARALEADAPAVHAEGNLCCEHVLEHGKTDEAFANAHLSISTTYETPAVEHAYLEPEAGVAVWDDGTVIIRAASQYPQAIQEQVAEILGMPRDRVRLVSPVVGGAFGGKTDISVHAHLALAAYHTKRRVRLTWTREDSLRASVKRHPMSMDYRMAFNEEGEILAVEGEILANAGAYESLSLPLLEQTAAFSTGPYRTPAVRVRVRGIYTNTAISSAFRGFGIPQPTFAVESLLDEAAERLGISPLELRHRNALRPGDRSATGQIMRADTHVVETIDALRNAYESIRAAAEPGEGVGIACGYKNIGLGLGESDHATAELEASADGGVVVRVGAVDVGQGSETIIGQLVADRLGVPTEQVRVLWGDTAHTPDGRETNASRQTVVSGNAVLDAAERLSDALVEQASVLSPELTAPVRYDRGLVGAGGERMEWNDICSQLDRPVKVSVRYLAPDTSPLRPWDESAEEAPVNYFAYTFFATLAHVAVDSRSGRTRVLRMISAYDIGKVINLQAAEGQIEGGAVMGIGYALSEAYLTFGEERTRTLAECRLPRSIAMPKLETIFVESGDSVGPHGAKGIGEVAMIAVAPSITNAIYDAVHVRVRELPATAARLRELLALSSEGGAS